MNHELGEESKLPDKLLPLDNDVPYTRQSIRNLKFHQPIEAVVLKASSGISVKKALQVDKSKPIASILREVKNMLNYKVGHYVHQKDLT